MRLQTIVSREVAAADSAVVTVGSLQAGTSENIIPDDARSGSTSAPSRTRCAPACWPRSSASWRRRPRSGAPKPPDFTILSNYPLTATTSRDAEVVAALERISARPGARDRARPASEDFGLFGAAWDVPSVFWFVGGIDPEEFKAAEQAGKLDEIPANHAPDFAPVLHPTLRTGVEAMLAAAGAWLTGGAVTP